MFLCVFNHLKLGFHYLRLIALYLHRKWYLIFTFLSYISLFFGHHWGW